MNKKNSIFVITGIFLICTRFWVSFGTVNIDISNDIVGYILIFLGINNMKELNSRFKKGMFLSLAGLAGAILSQYLIARDWPVPETMYSIAIGISVVFAIYYLLLYRSPCHGSKDTRKNCCYKKLSDNMASYVCRNIYPLFCIQVYNNNVVYSCWGPDCCNHNLLLFFSFFNQQAALWRLIALHFLTNIKLIFTLFVCTVRWLTFARRSVLMMSSARKDINYEKVRDYYQTWKTWWS